MLGSCGIFQSNEPKPAQSNTSPEWVASPPHTKAQLRAVGEARADTLPLAIQRATNRARSQLMVSLEGALTQWLHEVEEQSNSPDNLRQSLEELRKVIRENQLTRIREQNRNVQPTDNGGQRAWIAVGLAYEDLRRQAPAYQTMEDDLGSKQVREKLLELANQQRWIAPIPGDEPRGE